LSFGSLQPRPLNEELFKSNTHTHHFGRIGSECCPDGVVDNSLTEHLWRKNKLVCLAYGRSCSCLCTSGVGLRAETVGFVAIDGVRFSLLHNLAKGFQRIQGLRTSLAGIEKFKSEWFAGQLHFHTSRGLRMKFDCPGVGQRCKTRSSSVDYPQAIERRHYGEICSTTSCSTDCATTPTPLLQLQPQVHHHQPVLAQHIRVPRQSFDPDDVNDISRMSLLDLDPTNRKQVVEFFKYSIQIFSFHKDDLNELKQPNRFPNTLLKHTRR
jgi:hypothetical protein